MSMKRHFQVMKLVSMVFLVGSGYLAWAKKADSEKIDILNLPRFSKSLPPGTLAWATVDQLHPLQPQTGVREVFRKTDDFVGLLEKADGKFPDGLFETMLERNYVIPVYIGRTPKTDSRYGHEAALGYGSDRTHKASALAYAYERHYGRASLSEPMYSKRGRPLNFILVRVMENHFNLTPEQFAEQMVQDKHCYLESWSRTKAGGVRITPIKFSQLPEKVYETGDNPYRGLVGALQHRDLLERRPVDFSQFMFAKELANSGVVGWDDISLDASDKRYKAAMERAADFFANQGETRHCAKYLM